MFFKRRKKERDLIRRMKLVEQTKISKRKTEMYEINEIAEDLKYKMKADMLRAHDNAMWEVNKANKNTARKKGFRFYIVQSGAGIFRVYKTEDQFVTVGVAYPTYSHALDALFTFEAELRYNERREARKASEALREMRFVEHMYDENGNKRNTMNYCPSCGTNLKQYRNHSC